MTTDLKSLAERVEAGQASAGEVMAAFDGRRKEIRDLEKSWAILESLDAAQRLHDAVLPGWVWTHRIHMERSIITVDNDNHIQDDSCYGGGRVEKETEGKAPTPAAAWVAAILRAVDSRGALASGETG